MRNRHNHLATLRPNNNPEKVLFIESMQDDCGQQTSKAAITLFQEGVWRQDLMKPGVVIEGSSEGVQDKAVND